MHTLVPGFEDKFISDLKESIVIVKSYPTNKKPTENIKIYGTLGLLPTAVQEKFCSQYQKTRLFYNATCNKLGLCLSSEEEQSQESKTVLKL